MLRFIISVISVLVILDLTYTLVYLSKLIKKTEVDLSLVEYQLSMIEDVISGKIDIVDDESEE